MGILSNIKNFFKRKDTEMLDSEYENQWTNENTNAYGNFKYAIQRNDGSTLEISPVLNELGQQTYEQIYNQRTGYTQAMPKFNIFSDELKTICSNNNILSKNIVMDINPELLNDPKTLNYIANNMLNAERMNKVINDYEGYTGGISYDQYGNMEKYVDNGIINELKNRKSINNYAKECEQNGDAVRVDYINSMRKNAQNKETYIKTSHAEDLSKYKNYDDDGR